MTEMHRRPWQAAPRRLWMIAGLGSVAICLGGGCGTTLEDGYKPRGLDASPEVRKSYYASPFTDNAAAGEKGHGGGEGPRFGSR